MDRKSILVLGASFALLFLWMSVLVPKIWPPTPAPPRTNIVATVTNTLATGTNVPSPPVLTSNTNPAVTSLVPLVAPGSPEQTEKLESADAIYTFTSHGGGLKLVELKKYRETVGRTGSTNSQPASLNTRALAPVLALRGGAELTGDSLFRLTRTSPTGLRAEKILTNGLALVKDFQIVSNYLVRATVRLENRSAQPLALPAQSWVAGTATPLGPRDDEMKLGIFWYDGGDLDHKDRAWFDDKSSGCSMGTPHLDFTAGSNNVVWAAMHNQFFTIALMPGTNAIAATVSGRRIDLPAPTKEQIAADAKTVHDPHGLEATLGYPAVTLASGEAQTREFTIYAGPKEYKRLSQLPDKLDLVMDFGFFGFFSKALLLSMNGLHALGLGYGLAIIAITVIIKLVFWPLTAASTRSMKRMQELQPQMKAIQVKYKDDPAKMNKKTMEFMKENKVSPLGGCLPMALQIPVFFGFFQMIQSAIELRGAHFLWAADLSKSDTVFMLPGLDFPVNPLPIIMGASMFWQAQLTPPSPGMDPMQQKLMKYMPMMFLVFLYQQPAGLTLYWTVQNFLTIVQMKLTKTKPAGPGTVTVVTPAKKK